MLNTLSSFDWVLLFTFCFIFFLGLGSVLNEIFAACVGWLKGEKPSMPSAANELKLSWLFFVLLCVLTILFPVFFQKTLLLLLQRLQPKAAYSDGQKALFLAMGGQLGLVVLLVLLYKTHPFIYKTLNVYHLSIRAIIAKGFSAYARVLPLIFIVSVFWHWLLEWLAKKGCPISLKGQPLVELLLRGNFSPWLLFQMAFFIVIVAPVCEEILFRGIFYRFFSTRSSSLVALIISSLFFAALHGHFASFLPLFLLGMLLGETYIKTGNLWPSIFLHACFNFTSLLFVLKLQILQAP